MRSAIHADDVRVRRKPFLSNPFETVRGNIENTDDSSLGGDVQPMKSGINREHIRTEADPL
jgi:hypothetical protein